MLKILYWANVNDTPRPTQDAEILKALREAAEVSFFDIKSFDIKELIEEANKSDLFLFHAQVPAVDDITSMLMVERIETILKSVTCKKAMWFMDKVWLGKGMVIERLLPHINYAFFSDETWVRRMNEDVLPLHPAAPIEQIKGTYKPELACDIAMVGSMYGTRPKEYEFLKDAFGEGVKFFDNKFGTDLADVCASAKIMFIPQFPFDNFFWSERMYSYLSMGGLVVQQRTYGLKEEGFLDGEHYFEYEKEQDLVALLNSLLDSEEIRKQVAKNGQDFVKKHTYKERILELINKVNETKDIK